MPAFLPIETPSSTQQPGSLNMIPPGVNALILPGTVADLGRIVRGALIHALPDHVAGQTLRSDELFVEIYDLCRTIPELQVPAGWLPVQ